MQVEAVKHKTPAYSVCFKTAFKDLLKNEIRNQRGVVRDQTQRLNHVLFSYIKRLEELLADILEPNVLVRENCQLLTHAINTLTVQQQDANLSIASTESRKRKTRNNPDNETTTTAKRIKRYNLRSNIDGEEDVVVVEDEVDQNNSLPTSIHEQTEEQEVQIIIQTPESQPKSPPSTISEEQEFNIAEDRATTTTTATNTAVVEFNASMLDLVYEVIIDEQQQKEQQIRNLKDDILSPASPTFPPSPVAIKPVQDNEACVQRIYKDLYSFCQRN